MTRWRRGLVHQKLGEIQILIEFLMNLESFWNKGVESFQFILFEEEL